MQFIHSETNLQSDTIYIKSQFKLHTLTHKHVDKSRSLSI